MLWFVLFNTHQVLCRHFSCRKALSMGCRGSAGAPDSPTLSRVSCSCHPAELTAPSLPKCPMSLCVTDGLILALLKNKLPHLWLRASVSSGCCWAPGCDPSGTPTAAYLSRGRCGLPRPFSEKWYFKTKRWGRKWSGHCDCVGHHF
jgi:hypothetical protein